MSQENKHPIRLLQISDTHCYSSDDTALEWCPLPVYPNRSLRRLLTHLGTRAADYTAIVISGDLAQEESVATYQHLKEILEQLPCPVFVLPGNHDVAELMRNHLRPSATIRFIPQTRFGNWHCLFLDTSKPGTGLGYLDAQQLQVLEEQLTETAEHEHVLIFMHHHPVPIGSLWMDDKGLQDSEAFWQLLDRFPAVKAVCFGHIHQAFYGQHLSADQRKIAVYGTPATCLQLSHDSAQLGFTHADPGWRELILHPAGRIDTQVNYLPAYD